MPIQLTTVYSRETLIKFQNYSVASKKLFWTVMILCTALIIGEVALALALDIMSTTLMLCVALLLWVDLVYIFAYLILPRLTLKKSKLLDTVVDYTFSEDSFEMHAQNEYASDSSTVKYSMLSKVGKKGRGLYLYINRSQAFIADLSALSEEQIALLKTTLKSHLPAKKIKWRP